MYWRTILERNVTTVEELKNWLPLTPVEKLEIGEEIQKFPMSVTEYYMSLIRPEDPHDPIRKLAVPSAGAHSMEGSLDTSGEGSNTRIPGLQHKYEQTAMVLTSSECAMYCRHCFRRRMVGKQEDEITQNRNAVCGYVRSHPEINNVLLSGGDAFLLDTEDIEDWLEALTELPQLDFIRFGTRTPVTFPHRILLDPMLTDTLQYYGRKKQIYVVTHFNHPREVTKQARDAIQKLQSSGIVVKNQTVLMRGVNDESRVLGDLLRKITSMGVIQHYIFQCRPVQGVQNQFAVPLRVGQRIVKDALRMQNGLGKSADYTMSHRTGKIRVLGEIGRDEMLFQYQEAKDPDLTGRFFTRELEATENWLPDDLYL